MARASHQNNIVVHSSSLQNTVVPQSLNHSHQHLQGCCPYLAMIMMNCFCGIVDWQKVFSLISSQDHCQRYSPSLFSYTLRAGFEPAQNLEFRLCLIKLCSSDNHYTSVPQNTILWHRDINWLQKWLLHWILWTYTY